MPVRGIDQLGVDLVTDHDQVELRRALDVAQQFCAGVQPSGRVVRVDQNEDLRSDHAQRALELDEIRHPALVGVDERKGHGLQPHSVERRQKGWVVRSLNGHGVAGASRQPQNQLDRLDQIGLLPHRPGVKMPAVTVGHPAGELGPQRRPAQPIW